MVRSPRLLALAIGLAVAGPAFANEAERPLPPAVVAIVDYQRLLRDSLAAQSIRRQVEDLRLRFEDEIARERERLERADAELGRLRSELGPEAYREQRRAFEADVATVQRLVQERRRMLDVASAEAFQRVRDEVVEVMNDLGDVYAFNVVLPRSDVLVFTPDLDLTAEIMAALDQRLPIVAIMRHED
ncbi:MAG: OmpH family outer membrane protein [Geminicoccaceae bacterium]|nr:MAG: OmpH family outer membrane protein [Geminicoccaceae bacterium]